MNILNKIKDILHIEHHPRFTTRIVHTETDEYIVQFWDSDPLGFINYWQNWPCILDDLTLKNNRFPCLELALDRKRIIDEKVQYYLKKNKIKEVIE